MANIPELERVLQYIKDHPEQHDQNIWAAKHGCKTTMCFAGTAVALSDQYDLVWERGAITGIYSCAQAVDRETWEIVSVRGAAERILGLENRESSALFNWSRTRDDLELMVKNLANGDDVLKGMGESF
jgi:hypothetical protein